MKISPVKRMKPAGVTCLSMALLTFILVSFFIYPSWRDMQEFKGEIALLKGEKQWLQQELTYVPDREGEIERLSATLEKVETGVPPYRQLDDYFARLEKVLFQNNFQQQRVKIGPINHQGDSPYGFFDIRVSFLGSQGDILRFVREIEEGRKVLQVMELDFTQEGELLAGQLLVRAYISLPGGAERGDYW